MNTGKLMSAGVFTAITASLCCIAPVIALIAGTSNIASSFSWIGPARPYLIGFTIVILGFAWYQKLRPRPVDNCGCVVDEKPKFIESKTFLLIVTLFATLMIAFPSYAKVFFPKSDEKVVVVDNSTFQTVELNIKGMSCEACEVHVNHEVNKLAGIIKSETSYKKNNAIVQFDNSKTKVESIIDAVNSTGYEVIDHSEK